MPIGRSSSSRPSASQYPVIWLLIFSKHSDWNEHSPNPEFLGQFLDAMLRMRAELMAEHDHWPCSNS
jgi:hypothetical protein